VDREQLLYTLALAAQAKQAGLMDYAAPAAGAIGGAGVGFLASGGNPLGAVAGGLGGLAAGNKFNAWRAGSQPAPAPQFTPQQQAENVRYQHLNRPQVSALTKGGY
jgi:hypothetical protein